MSGRNRDRSEAILSFWLGEDLDTPEAIEERTKLWYGGAEWVDREIRDRFGDLPERALNGELDDWEREPRSCLALVLALDQFPRNLYRAQPGSFRYDPRAVEVAEQAVDRGFDRAVHPIAATFFYLPFEHSESLPHQERAVSLFASLANDSPEPLAKHVRDFGDYAERHRVVIARFGRFPHRNAILGRAPTPEETEYLTSGGESFAASSS